MRQRLVLLLSTVLLGLALGACAAPATGETEPVQPAAALPAVQAPDLDYSCKVDSDCEVKNIGNCCGYFPACVNTNASPNPEAVMAQCADSGMASVCGFREIQACSCVNSRCEAVQQAVAPLEQD